MYVAGGAYIVFAVLCGLAAGWVGKTRGQSFWIWFSVALVLPLVGNIAAVLSRNENDEPRRQCPRCQAVTFVYAAKCMKCGYELEYPADDEILPSVNELRMLRATGEA